MNKQFGVFLTLITLAFPFRAQSVRAQDTKECEQNSQYWERWEQVAQMATFADFTPPDFKLAISPDGSLLAVSKKNSLTLYDTQTLTLRTQLKSVAPVQNGNYTAISWSSDGHQLAAAYYVSDTPDEPNPVNGIQIWDVQQNQQVGLLNSRPKVMDWSPDSSMLAEADVSGDIWLWDVARGISSKLHERDTLNETLTDILIWSPDARYLAASNTYHGPLSLYTLDESEPQILESPEKINSYIVWSPSSDQLVTGNRSSSNLYLFKLDTGEIIETLNGSVGNQFDVQWSPDGALLARGTQNGLFLWDMKSDNTTPVSVFDEHMPPFFHMVWLSDSQSLISVDFEGSLYRWNVETGCVEAAFLQESKQD